MVCRVSSSNMGVVQSGFDCFEGMTGMRPCIPKPVEVMVGWRSIEERSNLLGMVAQSDELDYCGRGCAAWPGGSFDGTQEELRVADDTLTHRRLRPPPRAIEVVDFADTQDIARQRRHQLLAVSGVGPGQRHQRLHRGLRAQQPAPDRLLNRFGQDLYQGEAPADPTRGALELGGEIAKTKAVLVDEDPKGPRIFDGRPARSPLEPKGSKERLRRRHLEHQRAHEVLPEVLESLDPKVAVDEHELLAVGMDQDRRQLPLLRDRRGEPGPPGLGSDPGLGVSERELADLEGRHRVGPTPTRRRRSERCRLAAGPGHVGGIRQ